ncbi:MAG: serine/threonine protein kinase [Myxococcales bacterium]|nr:serine/threonine protein kinase [Myxococcales bacterium]
MSASIHPAPLRLGPYELVRRIATGGMAEVYLARREGPHGFQKVVAVKRILPQLAKDSDFVAMFVDEARVCARLAHPNIVQVFDFGEQDGELYMAMEYVDGTTGARLVRAAASKGEEIPLDVALYVALSVLRGLEYAHGVRGEDGQPLDLVHRDVSPGNVLIDRAGAVKLTDFGIARAAEMERRTETGQLKGKLGYMSPEQVVGRDLDPRSDLFTTAIVLAELLMLRPLFTGGSEMDVLLRIRDADLGALDRSAHRVPDDVRSILYRALSRQPELRYPTASAFADAIEEVLRRRRLPVGSGKLAAFVDKLGLVTSIAEAEPDSESGLRPTATLDVPGEVRGSSPRASVAPPSADTRDVAPSIYRVRLPDGKELGPLSYPRLVELFATAAVDGDVEIARESGSFRPARELDELSRFVSSGALRWDDGVFSPANDSAPIDRVLLPTRMAQLALRRQTGALCFRDGARRKKIYLVSGVPEFVVSTDKRELFGEYLVARGQVLRMEVEMALSMLPRYGGRIGDALVGLGVLRPIELFRAIHQQIQDRFLEVFHWRKGEMAFVKGARSHEETFPLGIDPYDIVHRGVRDAYGLAEMEAILDPLAEDPIEPVVPPPVRLEAFQFPEAEEGVLRALTKPMTLEDCLARPEMRRAGREASHRAIFVGLSFDLLRSARWREFVGVPL